MSIAADLAAFVVRQGATPICPPRRSTTRNADLQHDRERRARHDDRIIAHRSGNRKPNAAESEATLWFGGAEKLPVAAAARVNALTSDAAASDDSDLRNIVHAR